MMALHRPMSELETNYMVAECMKTSQCSPFKHHYDACAERVKQQEESEDGKVTENCVEECEWRR